MDEASIPDEKLYYFSAVQGILNRILNIEYTDELLFAYFITNETQKSLQQRLISSRQGDIVVKLTEKHLSRLTELTRNLLDSIRNDENIEAVLKNYVILLYSTTGNGNYLTEKGVIKI